MQNRESYYVDTQKAIDSAAILFYAKMAKVVPDIDFVSMETQASNAVYMKESRAVSMKMMGVGISEDDGFVYPAAIGFSGGLSKAPKFDTMMSALGVGAMMTVEFDANLIPAEIMVGSANFKVGGEIGVSVETKATVRFYRKGKGMIWYQDYYSLKGKENALALGYIIKESNLPRLFASSIDELPGKILESLNHDRAALEAAAAKATPAK